MPRGSTKRIPTRQQRALIGIAREAQLFEAEGKLTTDERYAYFKLIAEAGDKPLSPSDKLAILERARTTVALGPLLEAESGKPKEQHRKELFGG